MKKIILLITLLLLLISGSPGFSQNGESSITSNVPEGVSGTISVSNTLQSSGPPDQGLRSRQWQFHNPKIGSLLNHKISQTLLTEKQRLKTSPDNSLPQNSKQPENICVQIKCAAGSQTIPDKETRDKIRQRVEEAGGTVTGHNRNHTTIQALLPLTAVNSLANLPEINFIRLPCPAVTFGNFTTEALDDINADNWHSAGIKGTGTKIGIIDVGFKDYKALQGVDLPITIYAKNFVDGENDNQLDTSISAHGTACAEIIYDIAPNATMYMAKIDTDIDLKEAAAWMQTNHVDIISTSIGFYNLSPGDGTGDLADAVAQAYDAGILWVTAAGNDRHRHWGGLFSDPNNNGILNFTNGQEVNYFGPGDGSAWLINPGLTYSIWVRWSDWDSVNQDYEICVYRSTDGSWDGNNIIACSYDNQNGASGQTPTEVVEFSTTGAPAAYGFVIYHTLPVNKEVNFEIFIPNAPRLDEILINRSLANLADAPRATTVSAMDVNSYEVMSYSSMGPTNGPGGIATGGIEKPDITSYTNVSSNSYGSLGFSGTSAATPHVAGAAALTLSQNPSFNPAQLQSYLKNKAIDIGAGGFDFATGWGRLYLDLPKCSTPSSISVPSNSTSDSFQVTWGASSTSSVTYILEEATDSSFSSNLNTVYSGAELSASISGKSDGTYFYRVKATRDQYNDSSWKTGSNGCTVSIDTSDSVVWKGNSVLWDSSANWSNGAVPGSSDIVTIPGSPTGGHQPLISGISAAAKKVILSGNLTIASGELTIDN